MGASVLNPADLITPVLNPGERLIWIEQRRCGAIPLPAVRYRVLIAVGFGFFFERLVTYAADSLSTFAQIELFIVGGLLLVPVLWRDGVHEATTYAVTNRRLLIAVGPARKQIRELTFAELGSVRVSYDRYGVGRILEFAKRGPSGAPVWSFLDGGKPDKRFTPWKVDDPKAVQQLIKNANDQYWFGSGKD